MGYVDGSLCMRVVGRERWPWSCDKSTCSIEGNVVLSAKLIKSISSVVGNSLHSDQ